MRIHGTHVGLGKIRRVRKGGLIICETGDTDILVSVFTFQTTDWKTASRSVRGRQSAVARTILITSGRRGGSTAGLGGGGRRIGALPLSKITERGMETFGSIRVTHESGVTGALHAQVVVLSAQVASTRIGGGKGANE